MLNLPVQESQKLFASLDRKPGPWFIFLNDNLLQVFDLD